MIKPPRLYSEARQEYAIFELETLGQLAMEMNLQKDRSVKKQFEDIINMVGTHSFSERCLLLQQHLYSHAR
jgi:hypothetical protein